mmetsp:Transcript_18464/g.69862  ORF Transcript_18464/g.69862 Transcript_18464/m.69862 type:complete len:237 (+) Transcript_18464:300-1010(+)
MQPACRDEDTLPRPLQDLDRSGHALPVLHEVRKPVHGLELRRLCVQPDALPRGAGREHRPPLQALRQKEPRVRPKRIHVHPRATPTASHQDPPERRPVRLVPQVSQEVTSEAGWHRIVLEQLSLGNVRKLRIIQSQRGVVGSDHERVAAEFPLPLLHEQLVKLVGAPKTTFLHPHIPHVIPEGHGQAMRIADAPLLLPIVLCQGLQAPDIAESLGQEHAGDARRLGKPSEVLSKAC